MVLNQRQVLVIVSDWEPYLSSLLGVGVCGFVTPDRAVFGFARFLFLYIVHISSSLKMHQNTTLRFGPPLLQQKKPVIN
jgi:hypothetical protein